MYQDDRDRVKVQEIAALLEDVRRWDGGRERVKWWCPAGAHTFTPAGGACTAKWVGHTDGVQWVAWSPDGKTVCSGGGDEKEKGGRKAKIEDKQGRLSALAPGDGESISEVNDRDSIRVSSQYLDGDESPPLHEADARFALYERRMARTAEAPPVRGQR